MSPRTTVRGRRLPARSKGPALQGKAEVAPRKAVCTPSMSVMGEKRPSQGAGRGAGLLEGDGLDGRHGSVGDGQRRDDGRDAEAAARGDRRDDQADPGEEKRQQRHGDQPLPEALRLVDEVGASPRSAPT